MGTHSILFLSLLWHTVFAASDFPSLSSLKDIPLDKNGHLAEHWLLFPPDCANSPGGLSFSPEAVPGRRVGVAGGALAEALGLQACPQAVALELGTELKYVAHHHERFSNAGESANGREEAQRFRSWLDDLAHVETGWINFHSQPGGFVELFWVNPQTGAEVAQGPVYYGEPKTHWRVVFLDHKFRVRDPAHINGGGLVREMVATRHECFVVGTQPPLEAAFKVPRDRTSEFKATDEYENRRAHNVKRTFTEHGFSKVTVPLAVFGSIRTYYYNNLNNVEREDWGGKGLYVNWWEADPMMVQPPFGLKTKWHDALRPLAQEWIGGVELEDTDLYGMRIYSQGAKLLKHVDRESTHAVSMIINVDQSEDLASGEVEPWNLEINDHANDEPQLVGMEAGEMVFYESARCMHGRPEPLQGKFFVNLFAHYRPKGNPQWYREELATAPDADGKAVALAEVAKAQGGHLSPPEGTPKPLPVPPKEGEGGEMAAKKKQQKRKHPLLVQTAAAAAAGGLMRRKLSESASHVSGAVAAHPLVAKAASKVYVTTKAVKGHSSKAQLRVKQHVKHHSARYLKWLRRVGLGHLLHHLPAFLFVGGCLVACCGLGTLLGLAVSCARLVVLLALSCCCGRGGAGSGAGGGGASPSPKHHKKAVGAAKKGEDGGGSAGFGKWDAAKALQNSTGLDPKVRAAAAGGNFGVVKAWVSEVQLNPTSLTLDIGDRADRTALHLAAKAGHDDIVRLLLAKGCDPSPTDRARSVTPLHLAAMEGRGPCVKLLVDAGANVFLEDVDRATPLQLAKAAGNVGCTLLLERAEATAHEENTGSGGDNKAHLMDKESV